MKTFDTPAFIMNIHNDGFIEFKIKKGICLTEKEVWQSRDISVQHLPDKKFFVLTEAEHEFRLTQGARQAGASAEYARHVAAHALYTTNLSLKILSNLFIKISKPVVPTKFFDEREKAVAWLKSFIPTANV